jgi:hypothetical protein
MNPYLKIIVNAWGVWAEIPAEGDLERKLTTGSSSPGESTADRSLKETLAFRDLSQRVYNSVKDELRSECPDCVHVVVPNPENGNHLVLIYPGKKLTFFAQDRLIGQGYNGPIFLGYEPQKSPPLSLATVYRN